MRLQLISDIHSEFSYSPLNYCMNVEIAPNLDFLVIAGDLVVPKRQDINQVHGILDYFSTKARHILYVEGNHEFYGGDKGNVTRVLEELMPVNYVWLKNNAVTLDGVHFYGGAMWFANEDGQNGLFHEYLNDWSQIKGLGTWVYQENAAFRQGAFELVRPETIVITHHLPHMNSVPAKYKKEQTNRFFVSDQTPVIQQKQPRYWLHGHTHMPCDYFLGETHVVCNPYAYPNERKWMGKYPVVLLEV